MEILITRSHILKPGVIATEGEIIDLPPSEAQAKIVQGYATAARPVSVSKPPRQSATAASESTALPPLDLEQGSDPQQSLLDSGEMQNRDPQPDDRDPAPARPKGKGGR